MVIDDVGEALKTMWNFLIPRNFSKLAQKRE